MKATFIFLFLFAATHFSFSQWSTNPAVNNPVVTAPNQQNSQQIISDGSGGAIIVFMNYNTAINERDIYVQRINSAGIPQWGPNGVAICTIVANQQNPQLTTDGNGGAIIVWQDNRVFTIPAIFAQHINSAGTVTWPTDGISLGDGVIGQTQTQLISDGAGGAFVTWKNAATGFSSIQAQHIDANGTILWPTGGIAVSDHGAPEVPQIISDEAGGMIIAWNVYSGVFPSGNHDIYAQRINAAGVLQWGISGSVICSQTSPQTAAKLTTDGSNGAIICWQDLRAGSGNGNIYAQRVNSSGIVQWTVDGVPIATAAPQQLHARMMSDGAGGAFITWNNNSFVFAQRMSSTGTLLWGASGRLVRAAPGAEPQIVTDGSTGSIITWSNNVDVFAQRLDINGNLLWVSTGVNICSENTSMQILPKMIANAGGTAIITWVDYRNNSTTETDIYASKLHPNGTLPVSLLSFDLKRSNTSIRLHWQTSTEQNSHHFNIERSRDGLVFSSLAFINASGNSQSLKDYYFTDKNPLKGINYYRLQMVDMDDNFKYSKILNEYWQSNNGLQAFPNPARNHTLLLLGKPAKNTTALVFNASGQMVKSISIPDGQTGHKLDISALPKGEYMIRTNEEAAGVLRLVKQ